MGRPQVREFGKADIPAAAELLAARHRRARRSQPELPLAFEDPTAWHGDLNDLVAAPDGVVETEGGRLLGFMAGRKDLPPQDSMGARWGDPRAAFVPVHGHAVAADADALSTYLALYQAVSEVWVREGFFSHGIHVLAADATAHDAFVTMGFGRKVVAAVRSPNSPPPISASVDVREATPDDVKAIRRLEHELDYYHSHAPIFMPVDPATDAAAWNFMQSVIDDTSSAIFVAEQGGEVVGMNSLLRGGFFPPSVRGENHLYLYQGIVSEAARTDGVGEALLARSLRWASEQGFDQVGLHYFSANPQGGAFWRKHGFQAVHVGMSRLVDQRVAWARDWR